jgi:hypothetical protein
LPNSIDFTVFFLNQFFTAILIYLLTRGLFESDKCSRFTKSIGVIIFALTLIVTIFGLVSIYGFATASFFLNINHFIQAKRGSAWIIFVIASAGMALLIYFSIRYRQTLISLSTTLTIIFSPFFAVQAGQALRYALFVAPSINTHKDITIQKQKAQGRKTKVVVLLFDELDYRLTFVDRPVGLQLNELDRLKNESIFFTNAFPPANSTLLSVAALTSSSIVKLVKPLNNNDALVTSIDGMTSNWSRLPNLFEKLKQNGSRSAVLASYMPYCTVMGKNIDECKWYDQATQINSTGSTFFEKLINQYRILIETPSLSPFGQSIVIKENILRFIKFMDDAEAILANDDYELVYIHFPIPHSPNYYDRHKKDFSLSNSRFMGYTDSLSLVDRTIGDLRKIMEKKKIWDRVAVVVTADHWLRYSTQFDGKIDHRIPLLIKFPGATSCEVVNLPINTVLLSEIILNIENNNFSRREVLLEFIKNKGKNISPIETPGFD